MTAWHSYTHHQNTSNTLELVCSVVAFPPAKVDWTREGGGDVGLERFRLEYHEDQTDQDRVRHVLIIDNPRQEVSHSLR